MTMENQDLEILGRQPDDTLSEWWCLLNTWKWPDRLPNPDSCEYIPGGRRSALMDWVSEKLGDKRISQHWNCVYLSEEHRMTVGEHDDFWNRSSDPEAKARYEQRRLERTRAQMANG